MQTLISQGAFDEIVYDEVSSKATYIKKYRWPEWPGYQSGVTIAIGYDCGYADKARLKNDWSGRISPETIAALMPACGVRGQAAKPIAQRLRSVVDISWDAAISVFETVDIPRWYAATKAALPNFEKLSPDCKGALVSLSYNRGASYTDKSGEQRYREMRNIRKLMIAGEFDKIPAEFRAMKRLWPGSGLVGRREREAVLFERGLKTLPAKPVVIEVKADPHPKAAEPETTNPANSVEEAVNRATKKERSAQAAGGAGAVTGGASEGGKAITEQPAAPGVQFMPSVVAWSLIGVGVAIIVIAAVLIVKKRTEQKVLWARPELA